jgi:hypothetical protein
MFLLDFSDNLSATASSNQLILLLTDNEEEIICENPTKGIHSKINNSFFIKQLYKKNKGIIKIKNHSSVITTTTFYTANQYTNKNLKI